MKKLALAVAFLGLFAAKAHGSLSTIFDLTHSNTFQNVVTTYATVTITTDGSNLVSFDVQALQPNPPYTSIADNFGIQAFGFNLIQGVSVVSSTISSPTTGWSLNGSNQMDGFGTFLNVATGNGNSRIPDLQFTLQLSSSASDASDFEVLSTGGTADSFFAAHVAGFNDNSSNFVAGSTLDPPSTPEPASLAIWGVVSCLAAGAVAVGKSRRAHTERWTAENRASIDQMVRGATKT